jgi:hypothetical protein
VPTAPDDVKEFWLVIVKYAAQTRLYRFSEQLRAKLRLVGSRNSADAAWAALTGGHLLLTAADVCAVFDCMRAMRPGNALNAILQTIESHPGNTAADMWRRRGSAREGNT